MYPYIYIFGRQIGTYGLCMLLGFYLAAFCALKKGKPLGFKLEDLAIIGAMTFAGAIIGGGLLFVFVTYPIEVIIAFIQRGDFRFLASGIVFYGGLIGGVLGALIAVRITKCKFSVVERAVVPFVPLGHAVGRIGCVLGGCCHGFPYDGPLALYYPNSVTGLPPDQGYFPVQPLESVINVVICLVLLLAQKKLKRVTDTLFLYLSMYAISRFFLEMLRGDAIRGVWNGLSTSQYISLGLLAVGIAGLLWRKKPLAE